MLGKLTWLECRLWLAVAGITRFYPDHDFDYCDDDGDCDDGDDCDDCDYCDDCDDCDDDDDDDNCDDSDDCDDCHDCGDCNLKDFFHHSILLGLLVSLGLASTLSLPYTPII